MDEHMTMIEDCEARESRLSEWDATFLDSIKRQLQDGRALTAKQSYKLDEIWHHATLRG